MKAALLAITALSCGCATQTYRPPVQPLGATVNALAFGTSMTWGSLFREEPVWVKIKRVPFTKEDVPVGAIVATYWEGPGRRVLHRAHRHILDKEGRLVGIRTKGDGNWEADYFITTENRFEGIQVTP